MSGWRPAGDTTLVSAWLVVTTLLSTTFTCAFHAFTISKQIYMTFLKDTSKWQTLGQVGKSTPNSPYDQGAQRWGLARATDRLSTRQHSAPVKQPCHICAAHAQRQVSLEQGLMLSANAFYPPTRTSAHRCAVPLSAGSHFESAKQQYANTASTWRNMAVSKA